MAISASKKVLFTAATTITLILLVEALSWIGGRAELSDPLVTQEQQGWLPARVDDPLLFWSLRPGFRRQQEVLINSLGLRGPEISEKLPGELRILSLGESTTFGAKVGQEETYSAQLEQRLQRCAGPGTTVRVINGGVFGYSLFQGVTYLEHRGLDLDPDVVLLYFGYNDFLKVSYRESRDSGRRVGEPGSSDRQAFESRRRLPARISNLLAKSSNAYRRLLLAVEAGSPPHEVVADQDRVRVPAGDRSYLLERALDLCHEHGIRLTIAVPWYLSFDKHEDLLRAFGRRHDVPIVDLPAIFGELPRQRFFADRVHPNAAGHRLMAEAMAEALVEEWGESWRLSCPEPSPDELAGGFEGSRGPWASLRSK